MRRNADVRLRLAERYGTTADVLRERIRTGRVGIEAVRWAARLGHPDALALYPDEHRAAWNWMARRDAIVSVSLLAGGRRWRRVMVAWTCDVAERVLHVFEDAFPDDDRPRRAIELARRWSRGVPVRRERLRATSVLAVRSCVEAGEVYEDDAAQAADAAWCAIDATSTSQTRSASTAVIDSSSAMGATEAASHAISAVRSTATSSSERSWQQLRLAQYALGEVRP